MDDATTMSDTTPADTVSAARTSVSENPTQRHSPSSSLSQPNTTVPALRKQASSGLLASHSPAAGASPRTSRNASPQRKDARNGLNTSQIATQPSAAAIQRALSASNVPQLAASADTPARSTKTQRNADGNTQRLNQPRVKSPPPGSARRATTTLGTMSANKKSDNPPPNISIQNTNVPSGPQTAPLPRHTSADSTKSDQHLQTPTKLASRGPSGKSVLATVDEDGADATPVLPTPSSDVKPLTKIIDEDGKVLSDADLPKAAESGSESGGNKSDGRTSRRASLSQPMRRSKNSYTSLAGVKVRQADVPHNMTVETEIVPSIPHSGLTTMERNVKERGDGGGLAVKMKSSNETIRPKKERRQPSKKARSINQGTASSKADIFEARVASAVDEANSSDSDETYVYESNPPEPRRPRHHSRTPSVTSAHSVVEQRTGIRNVGEVLDDRKVAGKRSMKFSNNPFNSSDSPTDTQDGTVRSHHPRHYGRWGRTGNHASMFEPDSPFTQASRLRSNPHSLRHSRPNSPRSPQVAQFKSGASPVFAKRKDSPFDFDAEGADDERTPLMGTVRTPRSLRDPSRLGGENDSTASIDEYYGIRRRSRCGTLGGCLLGVLIFALVVLSTIGFLVMSNRPLSNIRVRRIENVLASEQELMLDLQVGAVNPNALNVDIGDMDLNIFAKSKYLEPPHKQELSSSRSGRTRNDYSLAAKKGSEGDDDSDLDSDAQTMLLGRIFHFDQDLSFPGSPIRYRMQYSVGELRLAHPGNKTENGGSDRWKQILHHPFELIVRGVLKYKLPVSARDESAAISASVVVHPEDGIDSMGRMRLEPVKHDDHWQWIDWDREKISHAEHAHVPVDAPL